MGVLIENQETVRRVAVLEGVNPAILRDAERLKTDLLNLAKDWGLSPVAGPFDHPFPDGGHGVTTVLILGQSHSIISTWPEDQRLEIDTGTCGDVRQLELKFEPDLIKKYLPRSLSSSLILPRFVDGRRCGVDTFLSRVYEREVNSSESLPVGSYYVTQYTLPPELPPQPNSSILDRGKLAIVEYYYPES